MRSGLAPPRVEVGLFILEGGVIETATDHSWAWKETLDRFLRDRAVAAGREFTEFRHPEDYLDFLEARPRLEGVKWFLASRGICLPTGHPSDPPRVETLTGIGNEEQETFHRRLERGGTKVSETTVLRLRGLKREGLKLALVCRGRPGASLPLRIRELFDVVVEGTGEGPAGETAPPEAFRETVGRTGGNKEQAFVVVGEVADAEAAQREDFGLVVGVGFGPKREALARAGAHLVLPHPADIDLGRIRNWVQNRAHALPSALFHWEDLRKRHAGKRAALFLDYDGTLTPIVPRPDLAVLSSEGRDILTRLAARWPTAILSGRRREEIAHLIGLPNLSYAGSHGFDIVGPKGTNLRHQVGEAQLTVLDQARRELTNELEECPGILLEDKRFSLAIHYRNVAPDRWPRIETVVDQVAAARPGLRKTQGKQVFELRPDLDWDKGKALLWLLSKLGLEGPDVVSIHIGDDVTDEDAFRATRGRGFGVLVAADPRPTQARYSLRDPAQVHEFLAKLSTIRRF